jgi:glycosyltransferase involved in cell wall biosynthesis
MRRRDCQAPDKMKIVQILPELDEGGVEGETLDLATYLAQQGYESIVISGGGRLVPQLIKGGCRHVYWPHIGEKSLRCLPYLPKLRKFLSAEKVDILHLRSRLPAWIGYLAWKSLPANLRPALVTTFHGFYSVNAYSSIMTKGERVVAVSETIRQHIVANYRIEPGKIELIHGGFDVSEFAPQSVNGSRIAQLWQRWLSGRGNQPIIILPGRLTGWKGQDILIDSLALLKDLQFNALLIGDTEENPSFTRKLLERIKHHGLEERVILAGHCEDMPAALLLADVVVSASSTQPEAFGKVAIEAMAMGRAVVATAHGGSLETVVPGVTGWLVPPLDPQKMAEALREALTHPEETFRRGAQGKKWVGERFTARTMCEKTVQLYRSAYDERLAARNRTTLTVMQLLPELNSGGVERGTLEMGRYLVGNGHRSIVVSGGGRLVAQLEKEGSRHYQKDIGSKSPLALFNIWPLRQLIRKEGVSVLHLRSRMPAWVGYFAWKSLPPKHRPLLVTTFHGFYSVNSYSAIMTKGEGVIAVSESIREHIDTNYQRRDKVRLIFRGVDAESFDPAKVAPERVAALAEAWQIDRSKPVLMLPGRLTRLKGQELFLKSLLLVKEKNYQAVLVGDPAENPGYSREIIDFIEQHDLSDRARCVGYCADMPAAFLIADLVLSTSSLEPEAFGRTTVEAMAMGRPVIATAHGGSLETVIPGENGWLVKPSDPASLAAAIDEALALEPSRLQHFGENGRQRVLENFTAKAMCEQTLAFYNCLIAAKKPDLPETTPPG